MAEYERKHGDFTMFEQMDKKSDKHADFNGKILLDGKEYWISGWKKKSKNGDKFISGRVGNEVNAKPSESFSKPAKKHDSDDEIPW